MNADFPWSSAAWIDPPSLSSPSSCHPTRDFTSGAWTRLVICSRIHLNKFFSCSLSKPRPRRSCNETSLETFFENRKIIFHLFARRIQQRFVVSCARFVPKLSFLRSTVQQTIRGTIEINELENREMFSVQSEIFKHFWFAFSAIEIFQIGPVALLSQRWFRYQLNPLGVIIRTREISITEDYSASSH